MLCNLTRGLVGGSFDRSEKQDEQARLVLTSTITPRELMHSCLLKYNSQVQVVETWK